MKNRIIALILAVLMLVPMFVMNIGAEEVAQAADFSNEEARLADENMNVCAVSENGLYELWYDNTTGELAVKNTKTGEIALSNHYDAQALERQNKDGTPIRTTSERLSQVYLNYTDIKSNATTQLNSYEHCVFYKGHTYDNLRHGIIINYVLKPTRSSEDKFSFSVKYEITNDGLRVSLLGSTINYDKVKYNLNTISILPDFNAAKRTDKGYTFIPDGSGAIIRFEDVLGKNFQAIISESMYGNDYAYYQVNIKNSEQYTMPVFGLVNNSVANGTGFFAIIEEGDSFAMPTSAHNVMLNSAYAVFKITPSDVYDLASFDKNGTQKNSSMTITSDKDYQGDYTVSYKLLTANATAKANNLENTYDTSYMGMAQCYRDYLTKNGSLKKNEEADEDVKLFIEVFGSIEVDDKFLSFPVRRNKPLTTFADVKTMQQYFSNEQENEITSIKNMSFILKGFANGGILSNYPTNMKWQKDVGGYNGLVDLINDSKDKGYEVTPEVDFVYSYGTTWFSGYSNDKNGVRTLDNRFTTKRIYYASTQTFERTGGVAVSSASFVYLYDKFYNSIKDIDFSTLATRTLGSDLNSDFDNDEFYDREASKDNTVALLKALTGANDRKAYNLIIDAGNSYAIPYASAILSASLDSSRRTNASEAIPFLGLVYHGSIEYAGNALNTEGDSKYMFLKALENGASLYYTLAMQNYEYLKFNESYNQYYSISYENLKETILETYKSYNELMKGKQDDYIVEHAFMNSEYGYNVTRDEDGKALNNSMVVLVVYEDGEGFILNYNDYAVTVEYEGTTYKLAGLGYAKYTKLVQEVE
ncbi:MAG: hypothetical protein IJ400_03250 [Clostridia bacterium]|nr:hypothetical protein [Clostridia bacterium]